jgi:hypothetical protein
MLAASRIGAGTNASIGPSKSSRFPHTRRRRVVASPLRHWLLSVTESVALPPKAMGELRCLGPKDQLPDRTRPPARRIAANAGRRWRVRALFPEWAILAIASLSVVGAAIFRSRQSQSKGVSVGVRNLALAVAGLAFDGIDFAAGRRRLRHHRETRSVAFGAGMLLDLRLHVEPFRPPQLAASFIIGQTRGRSLTLLGHADGLRRISVQSGQSGK